MIRVLLLGTPAVFQDEQPLHLARKTQRALLYYLACHIEPVSRAELAMMFWPEEDDAQARRHLREAISKLRAGLPEQDFWIQSTEQIGLDHSRVYVDVIHYQRLLARVWRNVIQVPTHLPLPDAVFNEINQALQMWRGTHFLSGANLPSRVELEHWQLNLAQDLEYSLQRLQERLAYHHAACGDLGQGVYWLRQALLSDELNETLHRQALEWLGRLGRRSETLAYIQYLRDVYQREVGGPPEPLQGLCRQLERPASGGPPPPSPWLDSPGLEIPYVGRAELLHALRRAYQTGGWLAITGEAGAGKTRLLRQFYNSLDPAPRLFYACAHAGSRSLPFQPIVSSLRQSVTREDWLRLGPTWGMHLALLLPELAGLWPRLPQPAAIEIAAARGQLFEALRQLVLLLAKDRPVLFIIDDAHWSDEATLDALAYLDEHGVFARRGLLALAARGEARSPALEDFLSRPRRPAHTRLEVAELTAAEIAEVTRYALGQTPPDDLVEILSTGTGGNPLFLLETLRAWLNAAASPDLSLRVETLPLVPNLRALLRERLHGFSEEKRSVLTTAAVIGHEFTPAVLETAAGLPTERLVQVLEDLERDHLIAPARSTGEQPLSYIFIHDQLRELLALDLSPARRRMLNRRAADALEAVMPAQTHQQAAALAERRETAGQDLEAFHLWLRAAGHAQHVYAWNEAYADYHRAARLVERIAARLQDDDLVELFGGWGELAYDLNDPDAQQEAYASLLAQGEDRANARLAGIALSGLASGRGLRGDCAGALDLIEQASPYLEESGDLYQRILARVRRGRFLMRLNRCNDAMAVFRQATALEPPAPDPRVRRVVVRAHSYLSLALNEAGYPRLALAAGETALHRSRLLMGPVASEARARNSLATASFYLGRYSEALAHCRAALQMGEAAIGCLRFGMMRSISARCLLALGDIDGAWEQCQLALEYGKSNHLPGVIGQANCLLGDLFRPLERLDEAIACYQAGLDAVEPQSFTGMEIRYRLGAALAGKGRLEAAGEHARASLAFASQSGLALIGYFACAYLVEIEIRAGELDAAEERLVACRQISLERGLAVVVARCSLSSVRLQRARGCPQAALPLAEQAAADARALGNPMLELSACEQLAAVQAENGLSTALTRRRALDLLGQLERQANHPAVRPAFLDFQTAILARNSWR